jgi:exopolyphosphatase / guanosine-5'-triphosphate,3'-diphosphate pyrophosphatase
MARTVQAIGSTVEESRRHRLAGLAVVGTAGLRMAANGGDLVQAVREQCGVVVEVISGDDEARPAYRAATTDLGSQGSRVVSTPMAAARSSPSARVTGSRRGSASRSVRCRFTEQFGMDGVVDDDVLTRAFAAIEQGIRAAGRPTAGRGHPWSAPASSAP